MKSVMLAMASAVALFSTSAAHAGSRIKDIVDIENVRENQLIGYGLVVGLKGSGDKLRNSPFTEESLKAMIERMGVTISDLNLKTTNVAAVTITANLPAFARAGSRIDVQVSAIGDATNLMGGTLIATEMKGLDGQTYAVAQGTVAVSGFEAKGSAAKVSRGSTTSARIANGAIVEREVGFNFAGSREIKLALKNPDFTTASAVTRIINATVPGAAQTLDPATVQLRLPQGYQGSVIDLVTSVENLSVEVDQRARIVIDEASGTVVMGSDVKVSRVAIAQGNLTISIAEAPVASQPNPLGNGDTVVLPRTAINVDDGDGKHLAIVDKNVSLRDLVDGLNALGVSPRDLITILQALKAAGAVQADIEVL